jgi:plastocyanin
MAMKPLPVYALLAVLTAHLALAGHAEAAVTIHGFGFKPDTAVVPVGTPVVWTNQDEIEHTVTAADSGAQPGFNGVLAGAGKTFRFTFTHAGTFPYTCARHSFMRGTIRVTPMGDH